MAEFCYECWKMIYKRNEPMEECIISKHLELCEGCGEYKQIVFARKEDYCFFKLRYLIAFLRGIIAICRYSWFIISYPYKKIKEVTQR